LCGPAGQKTNSASTAEKISIKHTHREKQEKKEIKIRRSATFLSFPQTVIFVMMRDPYNKYVRSKTLAYILIFSRAPAARGTRLTSKVIDRLVEKKKYI
jgi:hypothetical protein